jgi:hypothetical protein
MVALIWHFSWMIRGSSDVEVLVLRLCDRHVALESYMLAM